MKEQRYRQLAERAQREHKRTKDFLEKKGITLTDADDFEFFSQYFSPELLAYTTGKIKRVYNLFDDEAKNNLINFRNMTLKLRGLVDARHHVSH